MTLQWMWSIIRMAPAISSIPTCMLLCSESWPSLPVTGMVCFLYPLSLGWLSSTEWSRSDTGPWEFTLNFLMPCESHLRNPGWSPWWWMATCGGFSVTQAIPAIWGCLGPAGPSSTHHQSTNYNKLDPRWDLQRGYPAGSWPKLQNDENSVAVSFGY